MEPFLVLEREGSIAEMLDMNYMYVVAWVYLGRSLLAGEGLAIDP